MSHLESSTVHRYFELADSFVEVKVLQGEALELRAPRRLDRCAYRRVVIQTCMPEFERDASARLERLFPEDPLMAEDLLYQICIDVNPQLEIHKVRLHPAGARPQTIRREGPDPPDAADFPDRLRRAARDLERRLLRRVLGQEEAVHSVARAVEKAAAGLSAPDRPLSCSLFVGRTGTGKTELARRLASELYASAAHGGLVRIDCSEYALAHEYSKLIGSPPGYVGHEEGGQLTEALRRRPESIVLFDEVEKAHPRMHNVLLQILEEGSLTDGKGRRVGFERAFVILTSNAGAADIRAATHAVGFHRAQTLGAETLQDITGEALARQFAPEFLGRLDEVVLFRELDFRTVVRIARGHLTDLALRARRAGAAVAFTPAVARWVAERGYSPEYGARELRHVIQREIEPPLARLVLRGAARRGALVRARIRGGRPTFAVED